jgi:hypothetical protein
LRVELLRVPPLLCPATASGSLRKIRSDGLEHEFGWVDVSGDRRSILLETGREDVGILSNVWRGRRAREEVGQVSSGSFNVHEVQESIAPPK